MKRYGIVILMLASLPCAAAPATATTLARLGERAEYRIHFQAQGYLDLHKAIGADRREAPQASSRLALASTLSGRLIAVGLPSGVGRVVACRIEGPNFSVRGSVAGREHQDALVRREIARHWVFLSLGIDGRVDAVLFPSGLGFEARDLWRSLMSDLQFVRSVSDQARDTWRVSSENAVGGNWEMQYRRSGRSSYTKRALYRSADPATGVRSLPSGSLTIAIAGGTVQSVEGQTWVVTAIEGRTIGVNERAIHVRRERRHWDPLASRTLAVQFRTAKRDGLHLGLGGQDPELDQRRDRELLRECGGDITSLLARTATAVDGGYAALRAVIRRQPTTSTVLAARLVAAGLPSPATQTVAAVCAEVAHPRAQSALVSLAQAARWRRDKSTLRLLLPIIGGTRSARAETVGFLEAVSHDAEEEVATTALLALGASAEGLRDANTPAARREADRVLRLLLGRLNGATEEECFRVLAALGNAGLPGSLPTIRRFSSHPVELLRAAAYRALRFIPGTAPDGLLLAKLAAPDPAASVRREVAVALGYRRASAASVRDQRAALRREPEPAIRLVLQANLARAGLDLAARGSGLPELKRGEATLPLNR